MQLRRRCRRCSLGYTAVYLFVLFVASSTGIFLYNIYLNFYSGERNEEFRIFIIDENDLEDARIKPTKNIQLLREDYFNTTKLACRYPKLMIDNPDIRRHINPVKDPRPDCEISTNWVYVDNGTFRLSQEALRKHGPIVCAYRPILRSKDDFSTMEGARLFPIVDKMPLVSDFFRADCRARDGSLYSNIHSGIMFDAGLHMRHIWNPMAKTHLGYNVLMLGLDSVSRMAFMRLLPKSFSYLVKELGAVVLKGYNIVGDGTPAALLPILTGQTEQELPEARHGYAGAGTVDRFPWIWKKFKNNGYVTQWAEDLQSVGTFQLRLKGFQEAPVDHYGRPFYLVAESMRTSKPYCFGSITRLQTMLNWVRDLFDMYPSQPKFSFVFHSQYSHDSNNGLPYADEELLDFLKLMNRRDYLDNTMFILMTDHGSRFSLLRNTYQGKLEERLPFMSIRMPKLFQYKYPYSMYNLRLNSRRLTTPFDIHETFEHLFEFHSSDPYQSKTSRSHSLFQLIPENRTCSQAGVAQHWCTCLNWKDTSTDEPVIKEFGRQGVEFLNNFVSNYRNQCVTLKLYRINRANQLETNERLLKFVDSSDKDGRIPRFHNNTLTNSLINNITLEQAKYYQIQFETVPGHALFELTAEYNSLNDTFLIQRKHLSRLNKYGETSACITYKRPDFREICYCSDMLNLTDSFNTVRSHIVIKNKKYLIKTGRTVAYRNSGHR